MAATKKLNYTDLKSESDKATNEQVDDIFAQISSLGSTSSSSEKKEKSPAKATVTADDDEPIIMRNKVTKQVTEKKEKKNNIGYISLVVPESLKTKWKVFSSEHGLSLTDSIRLGMKLLSEMEQQELIKIDDGVITMNM